MAKARVQLELPVSVSAAEAVWYDTNRWPSFVDGLHHVVKVDPGWPREGSSVTWDSVPDGRGRVLERVVEYKVRAGQAVEVEDEQMHGTQTVSFAPRDEGSLITLELEWKRKYAGFTGPLVDGLFVKRAFNDALRRTLSRFRHEVRADREMGL